MIAFPEWLDHALNCPKYKVDTEEKTSEEINHPDCLIVLTSSGPLPDDAPFILKALGIGSIIFQTRFTSIEEMDEWIAEMIQRVPDFKPRYYSVYELKETHTFKPS